MSNLDKFAVIYNLCLTLISLLLSITWSNLDKFAVIYNCVSNLDKFAVIYKPVSNLDKFAVIYNLCLTLISLLLSITCV